MRHLRIQDKLFVAFLMIALLGGVIALVNLGSARQLAKGVSSIGHNLDKVQSIMVVHDHVQAIMAAEMRLLSRGLSRGEREAYYQELEEDFVALDTKLRAYEVLVKEQGEKQLLAVFYEQWQKWRSDGQVYLELCRRLDNTDILDPLKFQNTLFEKKEEAYQWVMSLRDAIDNEAPFVGAMSEKEGQLGTWLFGLSSQNSSLAVAIGKARKPLVKLYHSARKVNRLVASDQAKIADLLNAVFESETLPAKENLFAALDLMIDEADKASEIYALMSAKVEELSGEFAAINQNIKLLTVRNSEQAATVIADGNQEILLSNRVSLAALPVGMAAIFLLSVLLGRFMARPLITLHKGIEHFMASGDFESKVAVKGNDEIAQVGRSFNDMVDQLHFYYRELEEKHEEISEAREELSCANEELARANDELQSRSQSLEQNVQSRTRELAQQQEKMVELNAQLSQSNEKLSREIEEHRTTLTELLEAKEVAEAADRTKSAFLANMGHEIRTPMNAIIGLTTLALQQEVSAKVRDYLSTVKKSARGLLIVLDDILDFSKIETGQLALEKINFNLHDVLDNLETLYSHKADEKKIGFDVRIEDDVPLHLIGDPLRLGQVLANLTGNALKFTHEGQVTVLIAVQKSRGREVDLLFTVSDTGIGINESQQELLFDAFSQADESTSRQFGGTGLGLAISKRIVESCGGQIWLESVPGQGSAFHFTACFERQVQVELPSRYKDIFVGSRVLVVDDNKMFRHFMSKMFTAFYFEVETAESGENALDVLREMASLGALPHVILLDQTMPGMDGLSLVKVLSQENDFAAIPIVMISADGQDVTLRQKADELGVKAVLSKPVKRELLLSCLEVLLQAESSDAGGSGEKGLISAMENMAGHRILLVEDNSINRAVATELLISVGAEVVTAADGREALAKAQQGFDAILMDVQMPHLDGLEATRQIRQQSQLADLPIIAMTARAMPGDRQKCLEAGMDDYIAKPIEPEILYQVLSDAFQGGNKAAVSSSSLSRGDQDFVIPGIDVVRALGRINNNETLLRKLLAEFARDNKTVVDDMNSYFQAGEIDRVIHIVHTLKGVAGNLGAVSVQKAAFDVENSLRQHAQMPAEQVFILESRLHEVLDGIRKYSGLIPLNADEGDGGPLCPLPEGHELAQIMTTLLGHIEANTPKAERYLQELPHYASQQFEAGRNEIQLALEQFDFEQARMSLMQLATELGVALGEPVNR